MIHSVQHCLSLDPFYDRPWPSESHPGKFYTVRINWPEEDSDQWSCTCPYYINKGKCKHIEALSKYQICYWMQTVGPEQQTPEQKAHHICPRCGGATEEVLEDDKRN